MSITKNFCGAAGRGGRSLGLLARRYGPTGLVIFGGLFAIEAIRQAVKDTRNGGNEVFDDYEETKKGLETRLDDPEDAYNELDFKKDLKAAKRDRNIDTIKSYKKTGMKAAVAFGLIALGVGIRNHQFRSTLATLSATTASFAGYRANVIADQGEEKDFEYMYNVKSRKVEKTEIDPETGEEKKVEEEVKVVEDTGDPGIPGYSRWARWFDEKSTEWEKQPEYNLSFLRARQSEATTRLRRDGYLFLNDVYDMLGIPRTKEGQVYGWIYTKNNPVGDNQVDFGIYNVNRANRDFVNGYEPCILLDFNIDGPILDTFRNYIRC